MILVLQRTMATDRMTMGQLSMGESACTTVEPPLSMFRQRGERAVPAGQYPLVVDGEDVVLENTLDSRVALGVNILCGLSSTRHGLCRQKEARWLFRDPIVEAIGRGEAVLLDVVNPRQVA